MPQGCSSSACPLSLFFLSPSPLPTSPERVPYLQCFFVPAAWVWFLFVLRSFLKQTFCTSYPVLLGQQPEPPTYAYLVALSLAGMAKKRKLSSDPLPVEEAPDTPTKRAAAPPPESGLASLSKSIRGVIGRVTGSGNDFEVSPVVNGASPAPKHFLSKLLSDVKSQGGRFTENFGLLASLAETKLFAGGLADDRKYQVSAIRALPDAALLFRP
jgi:hypothetical protein